MEFLDEDARPRFVFQSGAGKGTNPLTEPQPSFNKPSKPLLFFTLSLSSLFFALSLFFLHSEPFQSLLFWFSLSLLLGPFAPTSLTAGDIRVGLGPLVDFPDQDSTAAADDDSKKRASNRRSKAQSRRSDEISSAVGPVVAVTNGGGKGNAVAAAATQVVMEEKEWKDEDVAILKKQLVKNPVGKPRRWEVIAEAFGGRHKAESVIKKAKELGEKKVDDSDSYAEFLKKRKAVDKRVENENENAGSDGEGEDGKGESEWSSGEDIALLNALKAFPKEASMRWEKVAAAVPGKSKAACVKRVAELKKGFRTAKAAS
ncbi:hypothetical protein RIF29_42433 [Crotalaria pallida]|uniref:Myb-like domain-containing protein n=1 Tax=Crotalaria pallida TaxID=3830 RepID=A0AAN9HWB5_CROPI